MLLIFNDLGTGKLLFAKLFVLNRCNIKLILLYL